MNYGITCTWVIAHDSFLLLKNQQEVWLKITHVISSNVCIFFKCVPTIFLTSLVSNILHLLPEEAELANLCYTDKMKC